MAQYLDLYVDQNTDFSQTLIVTNSDGTPTDLTGGSIASSLRRSNYSANSISFTTSIVDATQGSISLSLSHSVTATILPARYLYDVLFTDSSGNVHKIFYGILTVNPGVTGNTVLSFFGQ